MLPQLRQINLNKDGLFNLKMYMILKLFDNKKARVKCEKDGKPNFNKNFK